MGVLHRLVDAGNTVLIIEHHLDVIKQADHIIDLGPDGGDRGGEVVAEGTPEEVAANPHSATGAYLAPLLGHHPMPSSALAHAPGASNGRSGTNGSNGAKPRTARRAAATATR